MNQEQIREGNKLIAEFMGWNDNKFYCADTHSLFPK
jgi:hypothetical protein